MTRFLTIARNPGLETRTISLRNCIFVCCSSVQLWMENVVANICWAELFWWVNFTSWLLITSNTYERRPITRPTRIWSPDSMNLSLRYASVVNDRLTSPLSRLVFIARFYGQGISEYKWMRSGYQMLKKKNVVQWKINLSSCLRIEKTKLLDFEWRKSVICERSYRSV